MDIERNKAIVRRFVEEIFVEGRHETVDELVDDSFVAHTWPSTGHPKDDLKAAIDRVAGGLADATFTIDDLIAEGDRVAARLTTSATQVGVFMGMPPSGKRYTIEEIHVFRLRDGKVVEHWHQFDQIGLMKQLGAMPGSSPNANAGATDGKRSAAPTPGDGAPAARPSAPPATRTGAAPRA
jgi:steroid delta-isomerase-like uncharacterized protein